MKKLAGYAERLYPSLLAWVITTVVFVFRIFPIDKGLDNVLNSAITFSSIVIGFLGALMAILANLGKSGLIQLVNRFAGEDILFKYIRRTIQTGFVVLITSGCLFVLNGMIEKVVFIFWMWFVTYFFFSSYRIISLLMNLVFVDAEQILSRERVLASQQEKEDWKKGKI